MVMLSAKGITESTQPDESELVPFDLPGDDTPPFDAESAIYVDTRKIPQATAAAPDLLATLRQWAQMQRDSYEFLVRAFAGVPAGISVATSSVAVPSKFPPDLLAKPLENILVSDERLSLPGGCVSVLESAGICSVAMLAERMNGGGLTKIPRIGKAKAAVIGETLRAFIAAVEDHKNKDQDDGQNQSAHPTQTA